MPAGSLGVTDGNDFSVDRVWLAEGYRLNRGPIAIFEIENDDQLHVF